MNTIGRALLPACGFLAVVLRLVTGASLAAQPPGSRPEPDIGWCAFYPGVDVGMDELPRSGASILSVCAGGWSMTPAAGAFDASALERQIAYAEKHGLALALINEINPFYAPEWLRRQVKGAGQLVRNASGADGTIPSITSPVFAKAQEELVRKTVDFVKQRDRKRVVRYYHPGAEWWFPLGERYHPADVARFRQWLRGRHGTIERLNAAWKAHFASFDEAPAPRVDSLGKSRGRGGLSTVYSLDDGLAHGSWSTATVTSPAATPGTSTWAAVAPGKTYTASAWVRCADVRGPGAFVEIAWIGPRGGPPVAIDDGEPVRGTSDWRRTSVTARAPHDAGRAWILLKFQGSGAVSFDDVELREDGSDPNLAPNPGFETGDNAPTGWSFQNWGGSTGLAARHVRAEARSGSACVRIEAPRPAEDGRRFHNDAAAVHDWSTFWYEAAAEYINSLSRQVKRLDPSRPTASYLTMSWAFPSEWDETQRSAIAPDEVGRRGRDIDVFGMQLCAADGDPYRVTACLDLMRKYGKPLWAVDLVDFTSGVQIGYPAMDRVTQSAVQHGAKGIIYCAWHIPSVLDYSFHPRMKPDDIRRMLTDARAAVRLMEGMSVRPSGALVQPILPAAPGDEGGFKNDPRSFVGWYKVLERLHQTFDVVTLREIETGPSVLERYRWVLVPDCASLPEPVRARLAAFAQGGGRVVTAGRFGLRDEYGRPLDEAANRFPRMVLPDLGKDHAGDPIRDTHAGNTPPLFLWRTDTAEGERALTAARCAMRGVLGEAGSERDYALVDAGHGVRAVQYEAKDRRAVYMVNLGPENARGVRLRLRAAGRAQLRAFADLKPVELGAQSTGGWVEVSLPEFRSSVIVVVEGGG